jgi:response regulator RpfG family c-di-GMP phosphodiesterase
MMPEVSGEDIFELLKDDKKTKKIPVLILTARKNALKFDKNLEKCDLFFSKPFNNNELLTEVKKLVKIS